MPRNPVCVGGSLRGFSLRARSATDAVQVKNVSRFAQIGGLLACTALVLALSSGARAADPNKVLRLASPDIASLDPEQLIDSASGLVANAIFEGLYEWDYLARPAKLVPNTAAALPEITDGGLTWTIQITRGIYFTDDPAFKGKPRELVAEDFVYSYKRWLDPNLGTGGDLLAADLIVDARAEVEAARKPGAHFNYDRPLRGLRALDRYTFQLRLNQVNYPYTEFLLTIGVWAMAREVVEAAGDDILNRPVGTGPYRLKEWKHGSRIVLEANPKYRTVRFPRSSDPKHAELVRSMEGKTLPQLGTIEISIIDEDLPALLEFDRGKFDYVELGSAVIERLLVNGKLARGYASRGIAHYAFSDASLRSVFFNFNDPVIGGLEPPHIALRRAIALGFDVDTFIRTVYRGQALPANQLVPPEVTGHDPKAPMKSRYNPAAANALLDRSGYNKRDADGYRLAPDGKQLTLTFSIRRGTQMRDTEALWKKNMDALALRMQFHEAPAQDLLKEVEAGHFQIHFGGQGGTPSGFLILGELYSKASWLNLSRFRLPAYDQSLEQFIRASTSTEQIAAGRKMSELAEYYAPMIPLIHPLKNDFVHPWVMGFHPSPYVNNYWKYLDIDLAARP